MKSVVLESLPLDTLLQVLAVLYNRNQFKVFNGEQGILKVVGLAKVLGVTDVLLYNIVGRKTKASDKVLYALAHHFDLDLVQLQARALEHSATVISK